MLRPTVSSDSIDAAKKQLPYTSRKETNSNKAVVKLSTTDANVIARGRLQGLFSYIRPFRLSPDAESKTHPLRHLELISAHFSPFNFP